MRGVPGRGAAKRVAVPKIIAPDVAFYPTTMLTTIKMIEAKTLKY